MNKKFSTAAVLSLYTGILLGDFGDMQELAEFLVSGPVWTHQLAHGPFVKEVQKALKEQLPQLPDTSKEDIQKDWKGFLSTEIERLGDKLPVHPMGEPEKYAESLVEPLKLIGTKA